jgi:hypothetical protein
VKHSPFMYRSLDASKSATFSPLSRVPAVSLDAGYPALVGGFRMFTHKHVAPSLWDRLLSILTSKIEK